MISLEEIIKLAKAPVASDSAAKELILLGKISTLLYLEEKKKKITGVLVKSCQSNTVEDLEIITSYHLHRWDQTDYGSTFLAQLREMNHFKSHKHVIAFAGLDPSIHQSGQFEGMSKISKRGNRHLR